MACTYVPECILIENDVQPHVCDLFHMSVRDMFL